jgi:hypothetical protein
MMPKHAKSRANQHFAVSAKEAKSEAEQQVRLRAARTAELRALRLAKEEADRDAARQVTADKAAAAAKKGVRNLPRVHRGDY